ncbi:phBC6A51 family helix-turn-helix protein [Domibacillus aminovorans]|uniref:phBC6A51 family helix-turn-helix protein n=1 Tax=Domibacillus aminovorans TaxID=29332 RepID=UPI003D21A535
MKKVWDTSNFRKSAKTRPTLLTEGIKTMAARKKKRSKQPSQVPPLDERHYIAMELMIKPYFDKKRGRNRRLSRTEIAEIVGVSRMQLYRWEQRKDFQREKDKRLRSYLRKTVPNGRTYAEMALAGDVKAI